MVDTVAHRHRFQRERVNPFQATDIDGVLMRVGAALVMGGNAAMATAIMPGGAGVELLLAQRVVTVQEMQISQRHRGDEGAAAPAVGAVAAARVDQAVRQPQFQLHAAAVAAGPVQRLYADPAHLGDALYLLHGHAPYA